MEATPITGHRGARLAGIGAALALFLSVASLDVPNNASDHALIHWWSKSGNRTAAVISMYLMAAAALLFLGLLPRLRERLATRSRAGSAIAPVLYGAGITYVACLAFAGTLRGVIGRAVEQHNEARPGVDVLRYLPQVASTALGVFAMGAALVVVVAATIAVFRDAVFPRWLGVLGAVVAVGMGVANLAGVGELAIPLLSVWIIATSVLIGRTEPGANPLPLVASRTVAGPDLEL